MRVETIGDCTLYLGDCLEVLPTLAQVDAVVTDPPYGISGNVGKTERAKYAGQLRKFVYGEWDLTADLQPAFVELQRILSPTGSVYVFCGGEQLSDLLMWLQSLNYSTRTLAWIKKNPNVANGQHLWLPAVETIAYGKAHGGVFNAHCRPGAWFESPPSKRYHPTQKPDDIVTDFILSSTRPGQTVLDPFMGSGTTGVACVKTGRKFVGIEIDPTYFEIACRRIAAAQQQYALFTE